MRFKQLVTLRSLWLILLIASSWSGLACNLQVIRITNTPPPTNTLAPTATLTPQPTDTSSPGPTPTPFMTQTPAPTETPLPTLDMPYTDASSLLQGVCFKYLATLDGQSLTFDSPRDLNAFYNAVNESKRCVGLVQRGNFDFSNKQVIGTVITGQGCNISLAYDRTIQDDGLKQRTVIMQAAVTGDCGYGLVQPLLIAADRPPAGYKNLLSVVKSP